MTICCWTRERKETRGAVFKKQQFITVCYSTCVHIEMKQEGQFSKKIQLMTICYLTRVRKMKQEGQFSKKKKTIYYSMLFNLCANWNETRGAVFKKQQFITCMLFNLCAYWNETRGAVFKKIQLMTICCWKKQKNNNLLQYAIQLVCVLKWNKRGRTVLWAKNNNLLQYAIQLMYAYWNERRGTVFKKQSNCMIQLVCVLNWNKCDRN